MNYLRKQGMGGRAQPTMPPPEQQQIIQQPQQAGMPWACEALVWLTLKAGTFRSCCTICGLNR
jgi:hypothetical protein